MELSTVLFLIVMVTLAVVAIRRPGERRLIVTGVGAILAVLVFGLVLIATA